VISSSHNFLFVFHTCLGWIPNCPLKDYGGEGGGIDHLLKWLAVLKMGKDNILSHVSDCTWGLD
jgi:hypothetical protein